MSYKNFVYKVILICVLSLCVKFGLRSAGEITDALKVLNIESGFMRNDYNERKTYRRGREDRSHDRGRSDSRDRSREDRICFRCGQAGHIVRNCRASSKTVSQYRKRLDRSSSRDRDRSYSRENSRDREHRVRFNENNN